MLNQELGQQSDLSTEFDAQTYLLLARRRIFILITFAGIMPNKGLKSTNPDSYIDAGSITQKQISQICWYQTLRLRNFIYLELKQNRLRA